MALVVFLRGLNVGGHRRFRPALLAGELRRYEVVNVGAAGTFVVRKPGPLAAFRAELLRRLPFDAVVALCPGRDLLRFAAANPFPAARPRPGIVRFLSILSQPPALRPTLPAAFPPQGPWLVRVLGREKRFVFGAYRRHMRTIGCLGQLDKLFGVPATTRNWNTILALVRILQSP